MVQQLIDAADTAIELALKNNAVVRGTNEPSEVARLVNALPGNLVDAWSGFVDSGAMTVTAAFCHAKPRVAWASPLLNRTTRHEPELGDLLLIMDVSAGNKIRRRHALLIQVKKSTKSGAHCTLTKEEDLVQRHMYSDWPVFDVLGASGNASKLPPQKVNISDINLKNLQARYAVVRSIGSTNPGWTLELATATFSPPQPPIHKNFKSLGNVTLGTQQSLGKGLAELYSGVIGRECGVNDDWSTLVDFLEAYVWEHTASYDLPHVQAAPGAVPSALCSATSFLAGPSRSFIAYSGNRHVPGSQWMHLQLFEPAKNEGALYKWPGLNSPLQSPGEGMRPSSGFGVIRVVIDHPLKLDG